MPTVDPARFQAASALRALERALLRVAPNSQPLSGARKRMEAEKKVWLTVDLTDASAAHELIRAWSAVNVPFVELLEVLLEVDEEEWRRWLAEVKSALDTLTQEPKPEERSKLPSPLTTVWAMERIPPSLPEPATWRSLEGFSLEGHRRLKELRQTLAGALAPAFANSF